MPDLIHVSSFGVLIIHFSVRAKGWVPWVIYSWEIVQEHREEVESRENQWRTSVKNTVSSGRKAEGLEMKKPPSRRERNQHVAKAEKDAA